VKWRKKPVSVSDGMSKQEIEGRRDFRKVPTFTIDPADAKDYETMHFLSAERAKETILWK
jgi:exoribonuclease R